MQKVLVGREIAMNPTVLMSAYAVRGLDINASYTIYDLINQQKERGVAVIFVGEDLDVLLELSDRILVLCGGKVSGIVDGRTAADPVRTTIASGGKTTTTTTTTSATTTTTSSATTTSGSTTTTTVSTPDNVTTTTTTAPSDMPEVKKYGDANDDEGIDMGDVVIIMQALANPNKYGMEGSDDHHITKQGWVNADIKGTSAGVTTDDALAVQEYLLGKRKTLDGGIKGLNEPGGASK